MDIANISAKLFEVILALCALGTVAMGAMAWALKSAIGLIGNHLDHLRKSLEEMDKNEDNRHEKFLRVIEISSKTCHDTVDMMQKLASKDK